MHSRSTFCRRLVPAVLASYLLATTAAGLFHRHGSDCCRGGVCLAEPSQEKSPQEKSAQQHACCGHHHHSQNAPHDNCATETGGKQSTPNRPAPASHDGCAVCQFLAEQSEAPVLVTFETWAPLALYREAARSVEVIPPVASRHLARGPPSS